MNQTCNQTHVPWPWPPQAAAVVHTAAEPAPEATAAAITERLKASGLDKIIQSAQPFQGLEAMQSQALATFAAAQAAAAQAAAGQATVSMAAINQGLAKLAAAQEAIASAASGANDRKR